MCASEAAGNCGRVAVGSGKDLGIRTLGKKVSEAAELYEKSQRLEGEGQLHPAAGRSGPDLGRTRAPEEQDSKRSFCYSLGALKVV